MNEFEGNKPGLNFLGFYIKQFKAGKHNSGKRPGKNAGLLGFTTIIEPSKEKILNHYRVLDQKLDKLKTAKDIEVINILNPIIRGWCNYQSPWNSSHAYRTARNLLWNRLWRWAKRRHPNKGKRWIVRKYFEGKEWTLQTSNGLKLFMHNKYSAGKGWIKVEGSRSPFDGDETYWCSRMGEKFLTHDPQKARLLKAQRGKCPHCRLTFKPDDITEKHHIHHKYNGGKDADNNLILVHLHCHDLIHSQ